MFEYDALSVFEITVCTKMILFRLNCLSIYAQKQVDLIVLKQQPGDTNITSENIFSNYIITLSV